MKLDKYKKAIQLDPFGNLNAQLRLEILSAFSYKEKAYILLNTIIENAGIWRNKFPNNNLFSSLTNLCLDYLNEKIDKKDFYNHLNSAQTFIDNRINERLFKEGYAAMALIKLGLELISKKFDTQDEFDNNSDPENWSSLFYASLAYNGGYEDLDNVNKKLNIEFWNIFFKNILNKNESINKISIDTPFDVAHSIKNRNQTVNYIGLEVTKNISDIFHNMSDGFLNLLIRVIIINKSFSIVGFSNNVKIDNTKMFLIAKKNGLKEALTSLKNEMYNINSNEGAWLSAEISLLNKNIYYNFNYDLYLDDFGTFLDFHDFKEELNKFPRDKSYIPNWLNDITKDLD